MESRSFFFVALMMVPFAEHHIPSFRPRPLSPHELAQESVALASRGQRLSAESIEWLVPRGGFDWCEKGKNYQIVETWKDQRSCSPDI